MRSWSPWFARRVNKSKPIKLPMIGARINGVDPDKITNPGWRDYIARALARRLA